MGAKIELCDGCCKPRRDLKCRGEAAFCFVCRVEMDKGRVWNRQRGKYISLIQLEWEETAKDMTEREDCIFF